MSPYEQIYRALRRWKYCSIPSDGVGRGPLLVLLNLTLIEDRLEIAVWHEARK